MTRSNTTGYLTVLSKGQATLDTVPVAKLPSLPQIPGKALVCSISDHFWLEVLRAKVIEARDIYCIFCLWRCCFSALAMITTRPAIRRHIWSCHNPDDCHCQRVAFQDI
ncbi:MAG: hypothetical protein FRX48_03792 [Lasallia pustulata]|uniref:Uncharacterized protein n=1 Tax=Lasallia pustulata TaxID=136370 RepID=A0A5M8PT82_9LECA|nr:MAG: hypothetical protein FRX48_03792 [Lasallia pustulata]